MVVVLLIVRLVRFVGTHHVVLFLLNLAIWSEIVQTKMWTNVSTFLGSREHAWGATFTQF